MSREPKIGGKISHRERRNVTKRQTVVMLFPPVYVCLSECAITAAWIVVVSHPWALKRLIQSSKCFAVYRTREGAETLIESRRQALCALRAGHTGIGSSWRHRA